MPKAKAQFEISAVDKTKAAFGSVSKGLTGVGGKIALLTSALGGIGFGAFIKETIDSADKLAKFSVAIGVSVEDLSTLEHVLELAGTDVEAFSKGIKTAQVALFEASRGVKTYTDIFAELGIEYENVDGSLRTTNQLISDVSDSFKDMTDETKRSALAARLFGGAGKKLLPFLVQGSDAIKELQQEARDLGLELSGDTAAAAEQFNDDLLRLKGAASGAGIAMVSDLLPSLTKISTAMAGAAREGGLLQGLLVGFGGVIHELAGGEVGEVSRQIDNLNGELGVLQNRLSTASAVPFTDWLFGSEEEISADITKLEAQILDLEKKRERLLRPPETPTPDVPGAPRGAGALVDTSALDKINKQYDGLLDRLTREQALISDNSQLAQLRYDLEFGKLKELSPVQKEHLVDLAENLSISRAMIEADTEAAAALEKLTAEQEDYNKAIQDEIQALNDAADPFAVLSREITHLDELLNEGLSWDAYALAVENATSKAEGALDRLEGKVEEETDAIGEFALEAARSLQSTISDSLFNTMQGNFDDIGDSFTSLIDRMIADLLAAQISQYFFGDFDKTGKVGGIGGDFLSGLFPGFANGTNFAPGGFARVGENGPENIFLPRGSQVTPADQMGGMQVVNNFTVAGPIDRRSQQQIADAAFRGVTRANKRNG